MTSTLASLTIIVTITALHQAAAYGKSGCVALLLDLGAQLLKPNKYGHTALHFAAMNCHQATYQHLVEALQGEEPRYIAFNHI